jgi:hypothetical protein
MGFLQALVVVLPLIALIVKMFLDEFGKDRQERRDERIAISRTLSDLLEMWHQVRTMIHFQKALRDWFGLLGMPAGGESVILGQLEKTLPFPSVESLKDRYDAAVSLVAATDPFLAFRLRSRDLGPALLTMARRQIGVDEQAARVWSTIGPELERSILGDFDRVLRDLAARHGRKFKRKMEEELSKPYPDPEAMAMLENLLATLTAELTSRIAPISQPLSSSAPP